MKEQSNDNGILKKDTKGYYIEPIIGAKRIDCLFDNELLIELASRSIGKYVDIKGEFEYIGDDKSPSSVDVSELEVMPDEADLPTLYDLHGVAPDCTGCLSSEEFIRKMRDEEW